MLREQPFEESSRYFCGETKTCSNLPSIRVIRNVKQSKKIESVSIMSNQCKNCERDRDVNNNFVGYPSGYLTASTSNNNNNCSSVNRNTASAMTNGSCNNSSGATQIKAKIMFGSVGAIKELREKEHAEKARSTHAGRRQ